jgi:small subunit ribosomal protein S2
MAAVAMKQLLEAGVHFGHQTRRWNPKMAPYIYGERNGIHIIDLRQTVELIEEAAAFVRDLVADGGTILFVGTKKQAQAPIAEQAMAGGMPYVNYRWLGGMLTNFQTIQKRIYYMKELARMEETGEMNARPKKERLRLRRELSKLQQNLGGVGELTRVPDAIFVVDVNAETTAVKEAERLGLPVVALVDTNCDPDAVTYVIPGNDDAIRAAGLVASVIAQACREGRELSTKGGSGRRGGEEPEPVEDLVAEAATPGTED